MLVTAASTMDRFKCEDIKVKICAIGDNCIDYYTQSGDYYLGGGPLNVAVYYRRLGGEASYIGAVGKDHFGDLMKEGIAHKGVDISHLHIEEGTTALTKVEIVEGDRVFGDYDEGVMTDFRLRPEDLEFIKQHQAVVSGIWGHNADFFPELKAAGLITVYDYSTHIQDSADRAYLAEMDYIFYSADKLSLEALKEEMLALRAETPATIIATRGDQGSLCLDGQEFYSFGIIPAKVVDTIGAGDSFIAGFLYSRFRGQDIEASLKKGAETSAETISYLGAW